MSRLISEQLFVCVCFMMALLKYILMCGRMLEVIQNTAPFIYLFHFMLSIYYYKLHQSDYVHAMSQSVLIVFKAIDDLFQIVAS